MKLSVVIPVYLVEDTLQRCVESILKQEYDNLQIILVDDGSPDNSPEICERLAAQDKRISVVHQENKGLAAARNTGILHAQGSYITFVDSDDYIEENTFPSLMKVLCEHSEYDILEYPAVIKEGSEQSDTLSFRNTCYDSFHDYWLKGKGYRHSYAWNKIYRRSLFDDCLFKIGSVFEDVWTIPQLAVRCSYIATTALGCYHYCDNSSGITARAGRQDMQSLLEAHVMILPKVWGANDESIIYYMEVMNIQITVVRMGGKILLPPYPYRLRFLNSLGVKQNIKLLLLKLLGVNLLCKMFKCLKPLW